MAEAAVLRLIKQHNKPFGVQGLVDNLQSAGIKKTAVQKACDALVDSGQIVCKVPSAHTAVPRLLRLCHSDVSLLQYCLHLSHLPKQLYHGDTVCIQRYHQ